MLTHFLNGYIAGDGWFTKYEVGFSTVSEKLHIGLGYLLSRLGILFKNRIKKNNYVFSISGCRAEQLANTFTAKEVFFYKKLQPLYDYGKKSNAHFDGFDILPMDKEILSKLKSQGKDENGTDIFRKAEAIRLDNYIDKNENITLTMVKRIYQLIKDYKPKIELEVIKTMEELIETCDNVYFDRIVEIEAIEKPTDVYDLTVEDLHNFIGGNAPLILHNTILERTLAKYSSADIMVLTLCGERGNEIAETLENFRELEDPTTGKPMVERTCIIVNTSNMPVAAREASIYSGITIAEFYRDQGYRVSMLADSTSRWAEALREISGRLEEIPGEEGYPSYLPKLIGQFYERAGNVETLNGNPGSITIVGAVSPPAGDFSEPVTQYSLRFTNTLWALDIELARSRHYPAISWQLSYTRFMQEITRVMETQIAPDWGVTNRQLQGILQDEEELERIVRLFGKDTLSESQKGLLLTAELVKEGFLQQNAFSEHDSFCSPDKAYHMAKTLLIVHKLIQKKVSRHNFTVEDLQQEPWIEEVKRMSENDLESIKQLESEIFKQTEMF
jgi:V/A-type H+-transporting ATPase subunit A